MIHTTALNFLKPFPNQWTSKQHLFEAELSEAIDRFVQLFGYVGLAISLLAIPFDVYISQGANVSVLMGINIIGAVLFLTLVQPHLLPLHGRISSQLHLFGIYLLTLYLGGLAVALHHNPVALFTYILVMNSIIALFPWHTRDVLAFFVSGLVVFWLVGLFSVGLDSNNLMLMGALIGSSLISTIVHRFVLYNRWQFFLMRYELLTANASLERKSKVLRCANNHLRTANDNLTIFSRTVAHDLKNPLHTISGYGELLRECLAEQDDVELEQMADQVVQHVEKATAVVDSILLLAEVERKPVDIKPVAMDTIVSASIGQVLMDQTDVQVVLPTQWAGAVGYEPWLEAVWTNYISNACKYGGSPCQLIFGSEQLANPMCGFS